MLHLCLFLHLFLPFLRGKPDSRQSVFFGASMGSKGKREKKKKLGGKKASIQYSDNTLFMKPHVLLLFKAFFNHRKLHPVSLWSHHLRSYFHRGKKIVSIVKHWLSKMRPQGLSGREDRIPQTSTSHWWITALYFPFLLFPRPDSARYRRLSALHTGMHLLSPWKHIIRLTEQVCKAKWRQYLECETMIMQCICIIELFLTHLLICHLEKWATLTAWEKKKSGTNSSN